MSPPCPERAKVDAHFAGTIRPNEERTMRDHLSTCDGCRTRYERHLLLASLDPEALAPEVRMARGLGLAPDARTVAAPPRPAKAALARIVPLAASFVALAAAVLFLVRSPRAPGPVDDGFHPRGSVAVPPSGTAPPFAPERGPLVVFRVRRGSQELVRTSDAVLPGDELAFAYDNVDHLPFLMIFGVDPRAEGRIYWFYPAWVDAGESPSAVRAETSGGLHELGEAIRHPFASDRVELHALFLEAPVDVRAVEAAVRKRAENAGPVRLAGGVDHVVTLAVEP